MAKLKVFTFPDQILTQRAAPIPRVEKSYFKMADDMLETMYSAPGIGLAANQVGILERILVLDTEYDLEEPAEGAPIPPAAEVVDGLIVVNKKPKILINPQIVLLEGKQLFHEGCLSVPEYGADVERAAKVKLKYQDIDGRDQTLLAEGLLAVAIQHEIDHLDGKLFIDHLSPLKKSKVQKLLREERSLRELEERSGKSSRRPLSSAGSGSRKKKPEL